MNIKDKSYEKGKCERRCLRVKTWRAGFSIKCMRGDRTLVHLPFNADVLSKELAVFCNGCETH